ncbi:MAG: LuxR C-terminal-related transcriptional regulator [Planctomycetota bacterium]
MDVARKHKLVPAAIAAAEAEFADRLGDTEPAATSPSRRKERRQLVADFYRRVGQYLNALSRDPVVQPVELKTGRSILSPSANEVRQLKATLTPRPREVLDRLLAGDSEKEVARHLGISPHTVHDHVKLLYKTFDVASRGELLARFISDDA